MKSIGYKDLIVERSKDGGCYYRVTGKHYANGVLFTNLYANKNVGFSESEVTEVITIS